MPEDTLQTIKILTDLGALAIVLVIFYLYRADKKEEKAIDEKIKAEQRSDLKQSRNEVLEAFNKNTEARVVDAEATKELTQAVKAMHITFTELFAKALQNS